MKDRATKCICSVTTTKAIVVPDLLFADIVTATVTPIGTVSEENLFDNSMSMTVE